MGAKTRETLSRIRPYDLTINGQAHKWPKETITGAQIKELARSPADWIVTLFAEAPDGGQVLIPREQLNGPDSKGQEVRGPGAASSLGALM